MCENHTRSEGSDNTCSINVRKDPHIASAGTGREDAQFTTLVHPSNHPLELSNRLSQLLLSELHQGDQARYLSLSGYGRHRGFQHGR